MVRQYPTGAPAQHRACHTRSSRSNRPQAVRDGRGALSTSWRRAAAARIGGKRSSARAARCFLSSLALLTLTLGLLDACKPLAATPDRVEDVAHTRAATDQSDYNQALKAWTRSGSIYRKFSTELLVTATYQSLPFREAYVTAYAWAEQLNQEQKEALWQRQLAEARESHEFLIAAYVPELEANDLANPASGWRLYLEAERGDRVSPEDLRRIRKVTPFITGFYPYVTPWAKVFKARFPTRNPISGDPFPGSGDQTLSLVITSPSGMVRLTWQPESMSHPSSPSGSSQDPGGDETDRTKKDQRSTAAPN
jgi:hypothetical protein